MLLQGQPSLLPPTARIGLSRDHPHHRGLTRPQRVQWLLCSHRQAASGCKDQGQGNYSGSLGYKQGFHMGARAAHTKRAGQALLGQDPLALHTDPSQDGVVTAALGQLKGSLPGSLAAPNAGLVGPHPGVLPAIHWSRLQ